MMNPDKAWMPLKTLNLQLFAEPGDGAETSGEGAAQTQGTAGEGAQRTYTDAEVQALLAEANRRAQSEADRRVTQAVSRRDREHQRQMSLSGLDEHERALRERDQQIEDLQASLREAEANRNHLEVVRVLADRGLPVEFADLIDVGQNLEQAQQRIETLDAAWKRAVDEAASRMLAGRRAPAKGGGKATMTREDIMKITDAAERQQAIANNIELFRRS